MSASVSSVTERHNNSSGERTTDELRFVREFIVTLSEADSAGNDIAMSAADIPQIGESWPLATGLRVNPVVHRVRSRPLSDENRKLYLVEVEYSNSAQATGGGEPNTPEQVQLPWEETPTRSYDYETRERVLEHDYDGEKVCNSAGDKFDPMPVTVTFNRKIVIRRNTLTFNASQAGEIQNTVNENTLQIAGESISPKMAHLLRWTAEEAIFTHPVTNQNTVYYQELIEIEFAHFPEDGENYPRGFLLDVVDAGYHYLDGSGDKQRFQDDGGNDLSTPGFLDGVGGQLSDDAPAILLFRQYRTASWSALGSNL